jgi:4'-phosphopantetheinyl transferase
MPLGKGEIDVWRIGGEPNPGHLSEAEKCRADAIVCAKTRKNFVLSRVGIRFIAGKYLGEKIPVCDFVLSGDGKPHLEGLGDLHFNLSHSGDEVAVAFSRSPVGFDIETKVRRVNCGGLARRFFTESEARRVEGAGGEMREVFFGIWTAKEAVLKLEGRGIAGGLQRAVVESDRRALLDGREVFLDRVEWEGVSGAVASFDEISELRVRTEIL